MKSLDIVVPVYNEDIGVVKKIVTSLQTIFPDREQARIIIVDDGSDESYLLEEIKEWEGVLLCKHPVNMGYGQALKTGILSGSAPLIAIVDADGSYPVESLAALVKEMAECDMALGIRTGSVVKIPFLRRAPKQFLNLFASYLSGTHIADLNSGMRVFSRDLCYYFWGLLPKRFSFTSTMTMGAVMGGFRVKEKPIDYYKRVGNSSIQPIRDTIRFMKILIRLGMLFSPFKIFGPVAAILMAIGFTKGILIDYIINGYVGNMSITVILAAIQIFMMGLVADLIVKGRNLKLNNPSDPPS